MQHVLEGLSTHIQYLQQAGGKSNHSLQALKQPSKCSADSSDSKESDSEPQRDTDQYECYK